MPPETTTARSATCLEVLGIKHTILIPASDTRGQLTLLELNIPQGAGIPPHVHTGEDEAFFVLSGRVEFTIAGKSLVAAAGDALFGPRSVVHGFAAGDGGARMLVTITPAGIETMFAELAVLAGPPDMARISAIVERYGVRFA